MKRLIFLFALVAVISASSFAWAEDPLARHNEPSLKQRYDAFAESLDNRQLAEDYPGAIRNLDSSEQRKQIIGIKTLAATDEPSAISQLVPLLDSEDHGVQIMAAQAISGLVVRHELRRRDKSQLDRVVILPPGPNDLDLRPVS